MKLSKKLYWGLTLPAILLVGIGCVSLYSFWRIDRQMETIYDDRIVPLQQLKKISDSYGVSIIDAVNKAHEGLWTMDRALNSVHEATIQIKQNWVAYKATRLMPEETQLAGEIEILFYQADREIEQLKQVLQTEDNSSLDQFDGPLYNTIDPLITKIQQLSDLQLRVAKQERDKAALIYQNIWQLFIILLILAVIIASPIGYFLSQSVIATLKETINTLASASTQIASAAEEHERIAAHQAASLNQTTTTMAQLSASSQESAERSTTVAAGAQQALVRAQEGSKAVVQTLEGMSTLQEKVAALTVQILLLNEQMNQIGNISTSVSELAGQTNMLALNAAVEAVRAGEQGKGFAIVAGEIRKLATQSKESAQKINALIQNIQITINFTIKVTDNSTKTVEESVKTVHEMAGAFRDLADSANHSAFTTQQISLMAKQQLTAIQQVVEAMDALNIAAKETAEGISQTRIGTQKLNQAALELKTVV